MKGLFGHQRGCDPLIENYWVRPSWLNPQSNNTSLEWKMLALPSYSRRVQSCRKNHLSMKLGVFGVSELMGVLLTVENCFAPCGSSSQPGNVLEFFFAYLCLSRGLTKPRACGQNLVYSIDTVLRGTCSGL